MQAAVTIPAQPRNATGKGAARAARRAGLVPVEVYAHGKKNVSLAVEARVLSNEYFRGGFMSKVVALKVEGGKELFAIPRDVQLHPVSDVIEHADFLAVDAQSVIKVRVPVHLRNADKSVGIKRGGVLNVVAREVELLCPVASIPKELTVDLSAVDIGSSIHIHNIELPKGVSPATKGRDITIASITGRSKDEEPEATAAPAAAAGAVPATKAAAATAAAAAAPAAAAGAKPAEKKK